MKTLFTTLLAMGVLAFGTTTANAAVLTYFLTDSNVDTLDVTAPDYYARVQIRDAGLYDYGINGGELLLENTGDIEIIIAVNASMFTRDDNFGMDKFSFNYDMRVLGSPTNEVLDASAISIINIDPDAWKVKNTPNNVSEFGTFDIDLAGTGSSRTELLSFLITGVDGDVADNYAVNFAAHIAAFSDMDCDGCTSAYFAGDGHADRGLTPPVPIPAAAWLFGSGLIGLVGVARRKETTC